MTADISRGVARLLGELLDAMSLSDKHILVIGVSTSEVVGERIGSAGSQDVAKAIFSPVEELSEQRGFHVAYQCCEHLNRALVVRQHTVEQFGLTEVAVVPVANAGGSMATCVYRQWPDAVMAESVQAHAGIDIGDTFIGMHLRPVVVPVRPSVKKIGQANVTAARTRPKLIGGSRSVYVLDERKQ